jgi:hypothetical protein
MPKDINYEKQCKNKTTFSSVKMGREERIR